MLYTHPMGLESMISPSTWLLQAEELPIELELTGILPLRNFD